MHFSVNSPIGYRTRQKPLAQKIGSRAPIEQIATDRKLKIPENNWFPFGNSSPPQRSGRRRTMLAAGQEYMEQQFTHRSNSLDYKKELDRQVREKRNRDSEKRKKITQWEKQKHNEIEYYNPWGRPGAGAPNRNQNGQVISCYKQLKHFSDAKENNPKMSHQKHISPLQKRFRKEITNDISIHDYRSPKRPSAQRAYQPRSRGFLGSIGSIYDVDYDKKLMKKREEQQKWVEDLRRQCLEKEKRKEEERKLFEQQIRKEELEFEKVRQKISTMPLHHQTAGQKRQTGLAVVARKTPPLNIPSDNNAPLNHKHSSRPPALDSSGILHTYIHTNNSNSLKLSQEQKQRDEQMEMEQQKSKHKAESRRIQPSFMNPMVRCKRLKKMDNDFFADILPPREQRQILDESKINHNHQKGGANHGIERAEAILRRFLMEENAAC